MKFLPVFFLLFFAVIYAQTNDSLKAFPHTDSIKAKLSDFLSVKDSSAAKLNDSLSVKDSSRTLQKPDTIVVISQKPFDGNSFFINRHTYDRLDYRYAGDFFRVFNFSFTRDYGTIGQPNETLLYGTGFYGTSFFEDGILQNNRFPNQFDLNEIQTESVDSVEIIHLPRGFLYGSFNNSVSVNFISRDLIYKKPYSRIKYYQGANGEALVDVLFSENFFKRFNLSLDVTNRKLDSVFTNTAFSTWQVNVNLKYFLSDNLDLIASYNFVHLEIGLNGGVNYDSIINSNQNVSTLLYDNISAPVNTPFNHLSTKRHFFKLRLLSSISKSSFTDLNVYYKFNLDQTENPVDSLNLFDENKNKTFGVLARQDFTESIFNLSLNGNYETTDYHNRLQNYNALSTPSFMDKVFSLSSILTANFIDSSLTPSVFAKYSGRTYNDNLQNHSMNYGGLGFDLTYKLNEELKFYLGYSSYQTEISKNYTNAFEAGAQLSFDNLYINANYFRRNNFVNNDYPFISSFYYAADMHGVGINLNYSIWKIILETNSSFYMQQNSSNLFYEFPQTAFNGGLYYRDILFGSNLDLKTGFVAYYTGKSKDDLNNIIPASTRIDFTLAGEIRKVAMVYFTWENLLDSKYYIIPYYPMPARNIRFGIAWELFN